MHVLSIPLEADMTVSLTNDEIIHSYSVSPKFQQDEEPFSPFLLQDNDILHVITFVFVFWGEIAKGLLNRPERHWSRNNHERRYTKKDRKGN